MDRLTIRVVDMARIAFSTIKARKKNKAGYKAPSSRTVGQGQSVESRHTRVGDKKDRWTDKACQIAAVRRKYHNSYIFTQRL